MFKKKKKWLPTPERKDKGRVFCLFWVCTALVLFAASFTVHNMLRDSWAHWFFLLQVIWHCSLKSGFWTCLLDLFFFSWQRHKAECKHLGHEWVHTFLIKLDPIHTCIHQENCTLLAQTAFVERLDSSVEQYRWDDSGFEKASVCNQRVRFQAESTPRDTPPLLFSFPSLTDAPWKTGYKSQ